MLKVVIVEDEVHDARILQTFLEEIGATELLCTATNQAEAVACIIKHEPDLVFFDINLHGKPAFEVLETLNIYGIKSKIIFCTAYEEYAVRVFEYSDMPYLLKPVDKAKLQKVIERVSQYEGETAVQAAHKLSDLMKKIEFNTENERYWLAPDEIVYMRSEGSYTVIYLSEKEHITITKTLSETSQLLSEDTFERIHQSYLINKKYLRKLDKKNKICILVKDGHEFPVKYSRRLGKFW